MGNQQAAAIVGTGIATFAVLAVYAAETILIEEKIQNLDDIKSNKADKYQVFHYLRERWSWYCEDLARLKRLVVPTGALLAQTMKNNSLNTLRDVLDWVSNENNVKYSLIYSKGAYLPRETIKMGAGVCLEFSTLAVSMLRALGHSPNKTWVIGATRYDEDKKKRVGHAFIMIGTTIYEPQTGAKRDDYMVKWMPLYKWNDTQFRLYKINDKESHKEAWKKFLLSGGMNVKK
eukprot:444796_1